MKKILVIVLLLIPVAAFAANTKSLDFENSASEGAHATGTNAQPITSDDFTVEFWVKPESYAVDDNPRFVDIGDASNSFQIMRGGGAALLHTKHTQTDAALASHKWGAADVPLGAWSHYAVTVNASGAVTHVWFADADDTAHTDLADGGAGDSIGAGTAAATIFLAKRRDGGNYDGRIDDLRVWNGERSQANIDANFRTELVGNESGLVSYYKFNDDYVDDAGANDLTAVNSPTFNIDVPFSTAVASFQVWAMSLF